MFSHSNRKVTDRSSDSVPASELKYVEFWAFIKVGGSMSSSPGAHLICWIEDRPLPALT